VRAAALGRRGGAGGRVPPADGAARDPTSDPAGGEGTGLAADTALSGTLRRVVALADSVEDLLRPVPLMRPAEVEALRRYSNAENVEVARRLGVRPGDAAELDSLVAEGRLVALGDSARYWVVRELGASRPYVTPATRALLERLGEAFQARLTEMGLPPYRFEISSALRTPDSQAALRRSNSNATAGTSAHEFGTTVDIAYSGYAAPAELPAGLVAEGGARPELETMARYVLERMAARKSRELQAVLGKVMAEAQSRDEVLVTLERQQPVYHITVSEARR
jgi:hypothetical protein